MPKGRPIRKTLADYFKGHEQVFKAQTESMSTVTEHSTLRGDNDHYRFMEFLRRYLPTRFGVETGIVVNTLSDTGDHAFDIYKDGERLDIRQTSRETDIIVTDQFQHAPIASESAFNVFPIEMVVAVIEVTRNLSSKKLADDLHKVGIIREIADERHFFNQDQWEDDEGVPPPRGYVVGFGGNLTVEEANAAIAPIKDAYRPHGILLMGEYMLYRKPKSETFSKYADNSLFRFVTMLRYHFEKWPSERTDLIHYLPELPNAYPLTEDEMIETSEDYE